MPGYVLNGPKWASSTITWSFAATTYVRDAAAGNGFTGYITSTQAQAAVAAAIAQWQAVSGLTFVGVPDSADPAGAADIRFGYGDLGTSPNGSGEVGLTTSWATRAYGQSTAYLQPDAIVRLEDPSLVPFTAGADGQLSYGQGVGTLEQIALHEIGHALGLGHDVANPAAVMYPAATTSNRTLSADDIAGIQALYGAPSSSGVTAPPGTTPATPPATIPPTTTPPAPTPTTVVQVPPTPTVPPNPPTTALAGAHGSYQVAPDGTGKVLVTGPAGTTSLTPPATFAFSDGIGVLDATGNAEEVARLYQAAFHRGADLSGVQYWTGALDGHVLGLPQVAQGFIGSTEFQTAYGPLSDPAYVAQLFRNVLGREGDAGGQAFWTGRLAAGDSRAQVLAGFSDSFENKQSTIATIGDKDLAEAYRLYQAAFNRTPDSPGLGFWTRSLDAGATAAAVAQGFVDSGEFAQTYTGKDAAGFVAQLYANVLHRAPDAAGAQFWVGQINGGASRADVLLGFANSAENRAGTAAATHDGWVFLGTST